MNHQAWVDLDTQDIHRLLISLVQWNSRDEGIAIRLQHRQHGH
jgi:hypothetical protein